MSQIKITQDNVHLLLPSKVAQLADRLIQNGDAKDMVSAIHMVYSSPVYAKLEQEKTKYWWLGVNALFSYFSEVPKVANTIEIKSNAVNNAKLRYEGYKKLSEM